MLPTRYSKASTWTVAEAFCADERDQRDGKGGKVYIVIKVFGDVLEQVVEWMAGSGWR